MRVLIHIYFRIQMNCSAHKKPIEYVCKSSGCDFTPLCDECRKIHLKASKNDRAQHTSEIISLKRALEEAENNLSNNKKVLQQLIQPFNNEDKMHEMIKEQKTLLLRERDAIIEQVRRQFQDEITVLENKNNWFMRNNQDNFPFQEINEKIESIEELEREFKLNDQKLRQSLAFSIEFYIDKIRKEHPDFSSMKLQTNQYWAYDQIRHDFYLSRLTLKKNVFNVKLLKKINNESKKYFLIGDYQQGKHLHYFSPTDSCIRLYDIELEKWKSFASKKNLPSFGATVHDPKSGRFYLVGGTLNGRKSNTIYYYHPQTGWDESRIGMTVARSSAMVTLLSSEDPNHDYLLIAGGKGSDQKHLKHCELYDPTHDRIEQMPPMNFGVSSGALVTFNGTIVFRIGGLGEFNRTSAVICEIMEKFEFKKDSLQKWSYVELEAVVTEDPTKKFKLFYANQAAIQINHNEILVFGGWSHNNIGVKDSYIIEVEEITNVHGKKSNRYYARWINEKPLVSGEGFADLRPIIYNRRVVSLQNITQGENQVLEKEKRLIEFDMYNWYEYENIVNI